MARSVLSKRWIRMRVNPQLSNAIYIREDHGPGSPNEDDIGLYLSLLLVTYDNDTFEIRGVDSPDS